MSGSAAFFFSVTVQFLAICVGIILFYLFKQVAAHPLDLGDVLGHDETCGCSYSASYYSQSGATCGRFAEKMGGHIIGLRSCLFL